MGALQQRTAPKLKLKRESETSHHVGASRSDAAGGVSGQHHGVTNVDARASVEDAPQQQRSHHNRRRATWQPGSAHHCGGACTRKAGGYMRTSKHARHIREDRDRQLKKFTYWDVDDKQMQPLVYLGAASTEQGLLSDAHWGPALRLLQSVVMCVSVCVCGVF